MTVCTPGEGVGGGGGGGDVDASPNTVYNVLSIRKKTVSSIMSSKIMISFPSIHFRLCSGNLVMCTKTLRCIHV